ncbi:MAG: SPASM domain-containing protein [Oscillospiraceae bacterium]|nr:SPASM domain-containing protein [Oscillospiraceae bacterium]
MTAKEFSTKAYTYFFSGNKIISRISMEIALCLTMGSRRRNIEKVFSRIDKHGMPLFSRVEVETINRCNGKCTFCPVNKNDDPRPLIQMPDELFDKIVNELHEMDFSGQFCLFANNEPFMDKRLEAFAKKARELLPNAYIEIFSNGTLIKLDRFIEIIPHLDHLVIDNYNDKLRFNEPTRAIQAYLKKNPEHKSKVSIRMRRETNLLSSRGGQAPNNSKRKALPLSCLLPFYHLYIRPDGKIGLCCVDALYKHTLGDASVQSLKEIWFSETYSKVREMIKQGRDTMDVCKYCDSFGNYIEMHRNDKEWVTFHSSQSDNRET